MNERIKQSTIYEGSTTVILIFSMAVTRKMCYCSEKRTHTTVAHQIRQQLHRIYMVNNKLPLSLTQLIGSNIPNQYW